jgi:2,4-diketo-3-deoxy-L-fuconate hydrolase
MKIANYAGRASLIVGRDVVDLEQASGGAFGPDLQGLYEHFDAFVAAAPTFDLTNGVALDLAKLGSPAPKPAQVFAIGLNYFGHAEEAGLPIPTVPATFTKFPSSLGGPFDPVPRVGETVDWEVELVVVMAKHARNVAVEEAWGFIAGAAVGQDFSERTMQFAAGGQFSLGKSFEGFGPIGPWLVTLDELENVDELRLRCFINDDLVQDALTSDMVFSVSQLVAELSKVTELWPGDVIFTGTPAGVGITAKPPRFLAVGDIVRSEIVGIGEISNEVIAP